MASHSPRQPLQQLPHCGQEIELLRFVDMPWYSSERFYLLSEVEEACRDIYCLDEIDCADTERDRVRGGLPPPLYVDSSSRQILVFYITWDPQSQSWLSFDSRLRALFSRIPCVNAFTLLAVEVLYRDPYLETAKEAVAQAMHFLQERQPHAPGCVLFALSNNESAAPALDCVVDLMTRDMKGSGVDWSAVTLSRKEFLGHGSLGAAQSPDAVNGVRQMYVAVPLLQTWMHDTLKVSKRDERQQEETDEGSERERADREKARRRFDVTRLLALVFMLLSLLAWRIHSS